MNSIETILSQLGADASVIEHLSRIVEPSPLDLQIVLRSSAVSIFELIGAFEAAAKGAPFSPKLVAARLLVLPLGSAKAVGRVPEISDILQETRDQRVAQRKSSEDDVREILDASVAALLSSGEIKTAVPAPLPVSASLLAAQISMSLLTLEKPKASPRFLASVIISSE